MPENVFRKDREREFAAFIENRRAVGTLNPMRDKMKATTAVPGGGEETTTTLWPRLVHKL